MGGMFAGINISLAGMQTAQSGINVAGQNIANANTDGYTRKVLDLNPVHLQVQQLFDVSLYQGVEVASIDRARDLFLDQQWRVQAMEVGEDEVTSKIAVAMNDILGEPSNTGINEMLNNFYEAASDLSTNPELETARSTFINAGRALADAINQVDQGITDLKTSLDEPNTGKVSVTVTELNQKLIDLAKVSESVQHQETFGNDITTLLDKRDLLLDEISSIVDVTIERNKNGDFIGLIMNVNDSEAKVTSSIDFPDHSSAISPAILQASTNNTLELSVNNGNGTATGPFTVVFDDNSTIADVVKRINMTFQAAGGSGTIASVDKYDNLVIETENITGSRNTSTAAINVVGGTALTALGLTAGVTSGSDAEEVQILDRNFLDYKFKVVDGSSEVGFNPTKISLVTNDDSETPIGTVHNLSGKLGGYVKGTNIDIANMQTELNDFAISLKNNINRLLTQGKTEDLSTGAELFQGDDAATFAVRSAVISNPNLIAAGKSGASGDGTIAAEIADLFYESNAVVSSGADSEKAYIDSASASAILATMPLIEGQALTVHVDGTIDDGGSLVNAGGNGFGGDSLVQIQFLDETGTQVGATANLSTTAGPPETRATYTGTIPTGATHVQFVMNGTSFNDNDLTDNTGHFGIAIFQGTDNEYSSGFNDGFTDVVGEYATSANFAVHDYENSRALHNTIDNRRESVTGVSLEEEAANLIKFQSAYSANARVMVVVDKMLQEILNII